jgi:protocatechuate 3,4-dioxygenase beta subunit
MKQQKFSARRRQVMVLGLTGAGAVAAPAMAMAAVESPSHRPAGKIVVSGRILDASEGQALAGTQVEIWQADARGVRAEHSRTVVTTDGDGRYFAAIDGTGGPGGAAPRLHYRVSHPGYTARVTQMRATGAAQKSVTLTRDDEGATRASFEMTLAPRRALSMSAPSSAPDFVAL